MRLYSPHDYLLGIGFSSRQYSEGVSGRRTRRRGGEGGRREEGVIFGRMCLRKAFFQHNSNISGDVVRI